MKNDVKLRNLKTNRSIQPLSTIIGVWSGLVGYSITKEEIVLIVTAIKSNFPNYTIENIKHASELSTRGTFKTQYKGSFSALYVQSILSEYKIIRGGVLTDVSKQVQKLNAQKTLPIPSNEERISNVKTIIENAYDHQKDLKKTDDYVDLGNVIYDIIKKNKLIKIDNKEIEEATNYAKKKIVGRVKKENYSAVIRDEYIQKRNITNEKVIKFQKQYVVIRWLQTFSNKKELIKFTNSLTIDMI